MLGDKVNIIPSSNPMEGLAAAMEFSEDASVEENMENMSDRMKEIHSASITTAVRDSVVGKTVIHKDDYMGLVKDHEVVATNDLHDCLEKTIGNITTENTEIITVYYGDELTEERCNKEIELVQKDYPDLTFEIYNGGQPLYPMLLSAE